MNKNTYRLDRDAILDPSTGILHASPGAIRANRLKHYANQVAALRESFENSKELRIDAELPNLDDPDFRFVRSLGEVSATQARAKFIKTLKTLESDLVIAATMARETSAHDYVALGAISRFGKGTAVEFVK
jgi:hypothetical protein